MNKINFLLLLICCNLNIFAGEQKQRGDNVLKNYYNKYVDTDKQTLRNKVNWAITAIAIYDNPEISAKADNILFETISPLTDIFSKVENGELKESAIYDIYWETVILSRFINSEKLSSKVSEKTRQAVKSLLWDFVKNNDKNDNPYFKYEDLTQIYKSDNHDIIHRSLYLLAAQALKNDPKWSNVKYSDGSLPQQKFAWWCDNLMEYFRFRAANGVNVEIGSAGYAGVYLQPIFNIYDCSENTTVAQQAGKFLDLYFADAAQEVINGVRGGAKVRMYKTNVSYNYIADSLVCYNYILTGKPENFNRIFPTDCLVAAMSDYKLADVVYSLMVDTKQKGSYIYKSRRLAQGDNIIFDKPGDGYSATPIYQMQLPSALLKYTYTTPSYTLGTFTVDEAKTYMLLNSQNQWMGITTSASPQSRIVVGLTAASANDARTGYRELQAVQFKNIALITKQLAAKDVALLRLFVSNDFTMTDCSEQLSKREIELVSIDFKKKSYGNGLLIFENDVVYVAVVIMHSEGKTDYTTEDTSHGPGRFITFTHPDSYLAIEAAEKDEYGNVSEFITHICGNEYEFENNSDEIFYRSKRDKCELRMFSYNKIPQIDGKPVDVYPKIVYDSPYLFSEYDSGIVRVKGTDGNQLVLNFNYK